MVRAVHPGFGSLIRILNFYTSQIPDSGVEKAPEPGSGSATLYCGRQGSGIRIRDIVRRIWIL
jgi:hypothetical protein